VKKLIEEGKRAARAAMEKQEGSAPEPQKEESAPSSAAPPDESSPGRSE
jgi:hypothetical protein